MALVLAIIVTFLLVILLPIWPHSLHWGYYPSGFAGVLLSLLVLFMVFEAISS